MKLNSMSCSRSLVVLSVVVVWGLTSCSQEEEKPKITIGENGVQMNDAAKKEINDGLDNAQKDINKALDSMQKAVDEEGKK